MNLLIVEDNEKVRQMIKAVVLDLADHVFECGDGHQSLALYAQHQPDWVLMDIQMREMDGLETTTRIRASFPDAKIVIVTTFDDAILKQAARQAGACGYVLKENLLDVRHILARDDEGRRQSRRVRDEPKPQRKANEGDLS